MDILDRINEFEAAGFTRTQAELQMKTMMELKKDLVTKKDLDVLIREIQIFTRSIDAKFSAIDIKFSAMDIRFQGLESRLDAQDTKIKLVPLMTLLYLSGALLTYMGLSQYASILIDWLFQ